MNAKTSFHTLLSLTLVPLALGLGVAELAGCGSDVATCATVCGYPDAPTGCLDTCTSNQSACDSLGCGPTYQQSLTCYANTGSYTGGRSVCGALEVVPTSQGSTIVVEDAGH